MKANDYQTYQVAISPDLDISAEEFAIAWNADPDARDLATAHFAEEKAAQFIDPTLLVAALLSVPANVASAALYDLMKAVIERLRNEKEQAPALQASPAQPASPAPQSPQTPRKHLHIEQTRKADGSTIIIVDYEEA
ncbi:MAG TPA: hypothetical protein VGT44_09580 [Ktedonobacteraceae bacterium]|nr:hypothetical protein [Ktedonobacteraceae bacterium]